MNHLAKSLEGIIVNLKPCPFCGSDGVRSMRRDSHAGCSNSTCGAYNANLPISEWNTRATDPLLKEIAEALQQMADIYYGRDNQPFAGAYARKMDAVLQKYREQEAPNAK